jgi:hypothetical protein
MVTCKEFMVPRWRLVAAIAAAAALTGLPVLAAAAPAGAAARQAHPATVRPVIGSGLAALRQTAMLRQRAAVLAHSASITGVVVGLDGRRVPGACVSAIGSSRSYTTGASAAGKFDITGLAPGSYVLEYRDCAAPARYLTRFSGGASWRRTAARVAVTAYQVRHVPVMTLWPAHPATLLPDPASWRRMLANSDGVLSAAAAAKTGKITGVVTGKGRRLSGICVEAQPAGGGPSYVAATTHKNGTYELSDLRPGGYHVLFEPFNACPDRADWLEQNYRGHNQLFPLAFEANVVKVRKGSTTRAIDAKLIRGGQIAGKVTAASGKGLRGICVEALVQLKNLGFGFAAATGKTGVYALHALFPGTYHLVVLTGCSNSGNYAPAFLRPIRIRRTSHSTVNVEMHTGAIVTGAVGNSNGRPLSGICVFAYDSHQGALTSTGSSGLYRVIGLDTGGYQVNFSPGCNNNGNYLPADRSVRATEGKVTTLNVKLRTGAEFAGTVTDSAGHGLGGMCIELVGPANATPNVPESTSSNGAFVIDRVPSGSYEIGFSTGCGNNGNYAPYWWHQQPDLSTATPITVTAPDHIAVHAQMQTGGEITGTVTDSHGRRLTGVCVAAATAAFAPYDAFTQFATSQDGLFDLAGLEPGQYEVDFGCGAPAYADQWFPDAPDSASAHLVSVAAGQTSGISAVLEPAGAIAGVVTGQSGKPVADVCVQALDQNQPSGTSPALTSSRGTYQITGLALGSYHVEFSACAAHFHYATQWYRNRAVQTAPVPVHVRAGVTTENIDARLTFGGTISGRVTNVSGKPLFNICPVAYSSGGQPVTGHTSRAGTYKLPGLSTGSYTVEIEPCGGQNLVTVFKHARVVAPRATSGVNAKLLQGGSVEGQISAAEANTNIGLGYECAEVVSTNPNHAGGLGVSSLGGDWAATGFATGTYKLYFGDPLCGEGPPNVAAQWYNDQATQANATTVTITAGLTRFRINAILPLTGEITGAVSTASGAALSGACVTAFPADGSTPVVGVSGAGGYSLIDLQPGRYRVEFGAGCGATGYRTQWWRDASSRRTATVIKVTANHVVTGINASLSSTG